MKTTVLILSLLSAAALSVIPTASLAQGIPTYADPGTVLNYNWQQFQMDTRFPELRGWETRPLHEEDFAPKKVPVIEFMDTDVQGKIIKKKPDQPNTDAW